MRTMKDSGVEWIGEIPQDWEVVRVKYAFVRKNEKAMLENPTVLSLARSGVKVRDVSNNEGQLAESYFNYNPVEVGDLLLNPMDLYSGANCSVSKVEGVISPAYVNLKNRKDINATFYDYYFKVQYWMMALFAHGKGVSFENRWTLNIETLMNYPIVKPSYQEQCRITDYLDSKCSKIDSIIEKQQAVIERLKEYKISVITEAVTKGLNPDVEMKDSGVEWIGEVPEHWENKKLLSVLSMRVIDGPHESPELVDEGIPFISATAIENGKINFDMKRGYITAEYCDECDKRYRPQKGDILLIKLGASTGQVAIVETEERFNIWVPLAAIRCNGFIVPKFVYYAFQSDYFIKQMEQSWTYGTQQTLGVKTIERLRILCPSVEEQKMIVSFLDDKCKIIDIAVAKKEKIVFRLEEYKKSLIYEVVTGKKEV